MNMNNNNKNFTTDYLEVNQQPNQSIGEGDDHDQCFASSPPGYDRDNTEMGIQISTASSTMAHENHPVVQANNGHLPRFDVPIQPLVQHLEGLSPSSSLLADNDIHEEVDETHFMHLPAMESLIHDVTPIEIHDAHGHDPDVIRRVANTQPPPPPPSEQTAREQLIERERRGRLERERARLKQRLAISRERDEEDEVFAEVDRLQESVTSVENHSIDIMNLTDIYDEEENDDNDSDNEASIALLDETRGIIANAPIAIIDNIVGNDNEMIGNEPIRRNIALNETNGRNTNDSGVIENSGTLPLGYTMERFLQDGVVVSSSDVQGQAGISQSIEVNDSVVVHGDLNPGITNSAIVGSADHGDGISDHDSNTNHELVDLHSEHISSSIAEMSVTAEVEPSEILSTSPTISRVASSDIGIADLVMTTSVTGGASHRNERYDSYNENATRLARLTEAEILELADIDYASVGNLPPRSERDEQHLPSIQDLSGLGRLSNMGSEQTRTTMQESMSIVSTEMNVDIIQKDDSDDFKPNFDPNNHSDLDVVGNEQKMADIDSDDQCHTSSNDNVVVHDNGQNQPLADPTPLLKCSYEHSSIHQQNDNDLKIPPSKNTSEYTHDESLKSTSTSNLKEGKGYQINLENGKVERSNTMEASSENFNLPNRVIRPGFAKLPNHKNSSIHRRSLTTPNIPSFVEDFDYCKYNDDETTDSLDEKYDQLYRKESLFDPNNTPQYGSIDTNLKSTHSHAPPQNQHEGFHDSIADYPARHVVPFSQKIEADSDLNYTLEPDLGEKPLKVSQHDNGHDEGQTQERLSLIEGNNFKGSGTRRQSMSSLILDPIFHSVVILKSNEVEVENKDCDLYLGSNAIERAFPERFFALMATLIVEIPVLLMISGGSDNLCSLIGRKRYQLLMAILPLSSAISGNCGLQASSLSTRAISHLQVTEQNYTKWLRTELAAAALLGVVMGFVVGGIAFQASGYDFALGFTIFIANFISVLTAGLTGTIAPLLFTFIFKRDAGKWSGPIETAIQDIVGSFVMVILSYRILLFIGTENIDPSDTCGNTE